MNVATTAFLYSVSHQPAFAEGVLDPKGPIAEQERLLLINATEIMLVVGVPVIIATLAFAWWYRASNTRAAYTPDWSYSGRIELVVWSIPSMIILLLAGVTWISCHQLDPRAPIAAKAPPLRVQVVSLDWKWLFLLPDQHIASVNDLVVPDGVPLEFELTSATVMNAFFIPQLGTQIYTMPGMATRLTSLAAQPGNFPGFSSHFSGDGFSDMQFTVHVLQHTDFDRWTQRATAESVELDDPKLQRLLSPGRQPQPELLRLRKDDVFRKILRMSAPGNSM